MQKFQNDEAVSATIGVILIVLITVVLAALIAQFGFQITNDMPKQHNIGARVERYSDNVIVVKTIKGESEMLKTGGIDHNVQSEATYTCLVDGVPANPVTSAGIEIPDGGTSNFDASAPGDRMYFEASRDDDVGIAAQFTDGTAASVFSGRVP